MTYQVLWTDDALSTAETLAIQDREGMLGLFDRVDDLAEDPRPVDASIWGPNLMRLRVRNYRILYEVDDRRRLVEVIHVGRR